MDRKEIYHDRNKTLLLTAWVLVVIGSLSTFATGFFLEVLWKILVLGLLPFSVWTYCYKKKLFIFQMKYFMLISLAVYICSLIFTTKSIYVLLIIFIPLVLTMVYPESKPILIVGGLITAFVLVLTLIYPEQVFVGLPADRIRAGRIMVVLAFILVTIGLYMISKVNVQTLNQARAALRESERQKEQNDKLLTELRNSIDYLTGFSIQLRENVELTGRTAREITSTFNDISTGVEVQASSVTEISQSMAQIDAFVGEVLKENIYVTELSSTARQETEQGNQHVQTLFQNIKQVEKAASSTSEVMGQLHDKTEEIDTILSAIEEIANQTNLLSLNASIEAARAGEAGKGFAVVAMEIRKLAEHSQQSAQDISEIMGELRQQSDNVSLQVEHSNLAVEHCMLAMKEVESSFRSILEHIEGVSLTSSAVKDKSEGLETTLREVTERAEMVASITQESSAGVEQTSASNNEQTDRIEGIVKEFDRLDQMIANLKKLALSDIT
ncbi:methyl-accepting chemotaxis protein [Paenibacillus bouchesdurhonensis]|uniref:methyl-accepting chemotaxis protein n=1 Tax=Paenibacillus bouchesdurhonensis TaxID=1870990 RepID=UPI000DA600C5|nr:methyl-accepting chemotaxis protein [Paenibacillus bouchesdurhonensis]